MGESILVQKMEDPDDIQNEGQPDDIQEVLKLIAEQQARERRAQQKLNIDKSEHFPALGGEDPNKASAKYEDLIDLDKDVDDPFLMQQPSEIPLIDPDQLQTDKGLNIQLIDELAGLIKESQKNVEDKPIEPSQPKPQPDKNEAARILDL